MWPLIAFLRDEVAVLASQPLAGARAIAVAAWADGQS